MSPRQQSDEGSPLLEKDINKAVRFHSDADNVEIARRRSSSSSPPPASPSWATLTFWRLSAFTLPAALLLYLLGSRIDLGHGFRGGDNGGATGVGEGGVPSGPYRLAESHEGTTFFDHYEFYDGPDSLGSAGHNVYVSKSKAEGSGIVGFVTEVDTRTGDEGDEGVGEGEVFAYMASAPTAAGPRDSVRLEGKTRFDRGLFVLDVRHMPDGCGVWPAFWLTDEANWPRNGEIDVLEGVNGQTVAKTALHTSAQCSMYAQVPPWEKTGDWERVTGIPDTYTGEPDFETSKDADDCWVMAAHQWANQGCTAVHDKEGTLGAPVNDVGGGVYVLEWDPASGYMKSWVFSSPEVPPNLRDAVDTASSEDESRRVVPDPSSWDLPYAYFAIGDGTGCAADHFKNMRLVFNLAFCGAVSGNRFAGDCGVVAEEFAVMNEGGGMDPVATCEAYLESSPEALDEAYWKIKGVYVWQRELEEPREKEPQLF